MVQFCTIGVDRKNLFTPPLYNCQMYSYETTTNTFAIVDCMGEIPVGRHDPSLFCYDGKIYVFGGCNDNGVNSDETCEVYHRQRPEYLNWIPEPAHDKCNQMFCFEIKKRIWRRCTPFGETYAPDPEYFALARKPQLQLLDLDHFSFRHFGDMTISFLLLMSAS